MEQLVIDIESNDDALLIKELLKRFKKVEVKSFASDINEKEMQFRIQQGIKDADFGNVKDWNTVKTELATKIVQYK
ncbi:MAG: hypothetical protein IPL21_03910 [Saprospirales bacterium]|nr:hypothetical protein [Saprospirales bacterium]